MGRVSRKHQADDGSGNDNQRCIENVTKKCLVVEHGRTVVLERQRLWQEGRWIERNLFGSLQRGQYCPHNGPQGEGDGKSEQEHRRKAAGEGGERSAAVFSALCHAPCSVRRTRTKANVKTRLSRKIMTAPADPTPMRSSVNAS